MNRTGVWRGRRSSHPRVPPRSPKIPVGCGAADSETRVTPPADQERVIDLVLGVARLGEAGLRELWQSHGLDQAGQYRAGRLLPPHLALRGASLHRVGQAQARGDAWLTDGSAPLLRRAAVPPARSAGGSGRFAAGRPRRPSTFSGVDGYKRGRRGRWFRASSRPIYRCRARRSCHDRKKLAAAYLDQSGDFRAYFDLAR